MKKTLSLLLLLSMVLGLFLMPGALAEPKIEKLTWVQGTGADAPTDSAIVMEALNAISREKLGVEVDIIYMTNEQVLTSIQAGEVHDMYFTCDWYNDYVTQAYAGIFADITELVQSETPDLYATMPETVWEGAKVNDKIYAIPVKKDYCPEIFLMFDKNFYADQGMDIPANMKFSEMEPYLAAYKKAYPDKYPLVLTKVPSGIDGTFNFVNRNTLIGFPYSAVGTADATKIISVFEDKEMIENFTALHQWYKNGYINPDAATTESEGVDNTQTFVKIGQGFYGADAIWSAAYEYPIQISKISGPYLSASGVRGSMNAFSSTLENNVDRLKLCLKYQELVNTDLQYRDILRYGIEGTHFNYNEDKTVSRTTGGVKNYNPWAFSQGSYALSSVEASNSDAVSVDPNMWNVVFAGYEKALVAADFGFNYDPSNCEMQIAQIIVIKDKWFGQIYTGSLDPAKAIPECIAEMEAAGLRDVIADAQAQLDAYLAAK